MTDVTIFTVPHAKDPLRGFVNLPFRFYDWSMQAEQERLSAKQFIPLEVHSHFTLLGAVPSVAQLVLKASEDGLSHLALTDTNALYGAVTFDQACRAAGIQPILGITIEVQPPPIENWNQLSEETAQLVLLARNPAGYRSLCRLSSHMQTRSRKTVASKGGLAWDLLKEYRQGLICLSGGTEGWLYRLLSHDEVQAAARFASLLADLYRDDTWLRLEIRRPKDTAITREVNALSQRLGLPAVVAQAVYYLQPDDVQILRLLQAIGGSHPIGSITRDLSGRSWLSSKQMASRYKEFPEALDQIDAVASRCGAVLPDGRPIFPVVSTEETDGDNLSADEMLAELTEKGLREQYGSEPEPGIKLRLQHELSAVARTGYAPLFLIVSDIVRFARENDIPVSTRGSVANSLVAYCSGITTVDPIAHDLLFERFISPARLDPPDIDLDFCSRRRDEVLAYVRTKFGEDKVALVATVSTMQPKSAVRETAKALGLDDEHTADLIKRLPRRWHPDPRRRSQRTMADLISELDDERSRQVVALALDLVGTPHHMSIHPGGVVITPGPLTDFVPLQWTPKGFLITQYAHEDIEKIGLPKLDLLGIRALTVLADTADLIREHRDPGFRLSKIPLDDSDTGDLLESGRSFGVFQCESAGAQRTMRKLRARTVRDLAVANAFFKPGPATGGMAQAFVRRYRGEEKVAFLHPALEPILGSTQGVLLFQEQILRVVTEIAGLSWEQADHIRRGMTKFKPEEMDALHAEFVSGCQLPPPHGPGFTPHQASTLWEQVKAFSGYGFNQGHATAYADISYRSAYLKSHFPEAFLCARLADRGGFHHPAVYMAEATRLGLQIRPPHVNFSDKAFTLTHGLGDSSLHTPRPTSSPESFSHQPASGKAKAILWMGLGQVRDLRRSSVREIIDQRSIRPFSNMRDLTERVALQTKELVHLIQCGALDGFAPSRAALLVEASFARQAGSTRQISFDFVSTEVPTETMAERLEWERFILGLPVSVHPLDLVNEDRTDLLLLNILDSEGGRNLAGQRIRTIGVRLPGWTGGPGFFLGDKQSFITVNDEGLTGEKPQPWQPILVFGRWRQDQWGTRWLQADKIQPVL